MSLPFENALQRERGHQRRQREGGQHTDLSARMDTPTLSPTGVGSPTVPPPLQDLSSMRDMVTELTRPIDRAQLDQEIEDFNLTYPVNVDDALNAFTLPPVAGTDTAPATTTTTAPPPPPPSITTATQTCPTTSTRTRPTTTTTSRRPRPVTSTRTRPVTTAPSRPLAARRSAGARTRTTTSTVTTPSGRPRIAAKQPRRRPRVPSPPSPDSSPPPSDDDEDRRRGLR